MANEKQTSYSTSDFRLAAFLLAAGSKMVDVVPGADRRLSFCFADGTELQNLIKDYQFGDPLISVRKLYDAESRLKTLIFTTPTKK